MNLSDFNKEFSNRHDFNSEDLLVLQEKFQNIKFENIPESWIILVDKMVHAIQNKTSTQLLSVNQRFGLLILSFFGQVEPKAIEIYEFFQKKIYKIDQDLHNQLSNSVPPNKLD